jgi:hypothetical protein
VKDVVELVVLEVEEGRDEGVDGVEWSGAARARRREAGRIEFENQVSTLPNDSMAPIQARMPVFSRQQNLPTIKRWNNIYF